MSAPDLLRPLPIRPMGNGVASDARLIRFDRADPRWGEPLVDVAAAGLPAQSWYWRDDGGNAPYHRRIAGAVPRVLARKSVVERLARADALVRPLGLRIETLDAWRPVETQQGLWDFFWQAIGAAEPRLDEAALTAKVKTFVSDPRRFDPADDTTWPIHSTGGSVDVRLIEAGTGAPLDHGAGFDEAHERSFTDHYERLAAEGATAPDDQRLTARRILVNAMAAAGFTNYAFEYWHFDFGTQLHVQTLKESGAAAPSLAWYGTTTPESAP